MNPYLQEFITQAVSMPTGVKLLGISLGICRDTLRWDYQSASKRIPDLMLILSSCRRHFLGKPTQQGMKCGLGRHLTESVRLDSDCHWISEGCLSIGEKETLCTCSPALCLQTVHIGH